MIKNSLFVRETLLVLLCVFSSFPDLSGQNLFVPLEMQKAYKNNTRSLDGKPGKNYWSNFANYDISCELLVKEKKLKGSETIDYFNNSPDTLKELVVSLFQDFFKPGSVRDWEIDSFDMTDGTEIRDMYINNKIIDCKNPKIVRHSNTNMIIKLTEDLLPGKKLELKLKWTFKIPEKETERMGNYDSTTFFLAYWYPQISVYDELDKWDKLNFAGRQEFNREFASYRVEISVPQNLTLWATGELQQPEKVYGKDILERYYESWKTDKTIRIIGINDFKPLSYDKKVKWHYSADSITDFSFAASNHMLWDAASLCVGTESKQRVQAGCVYFQKDMKDLDIIAQTQRSAIRYFSNVFPAMPYPYSHHTTFFGVPFYDGMEFAMMANNGKSTGGKDSIDFMNTVGVSIHELAHSYFPFYININERKYCWMEEGTAVLLDEMATKAILSELGRDMGDTEKIRLARLFKNSAGKYEEVSLMTHSILLRERNVHKYNCYYKPFAAYLVLKDVLGDSVFSACFKEYLTRWKNKRPTPYDFFNTFENVSCKDLGWLWKSWFFGTGYPDLAINGYKDNIISISKIGSYPIPIEIEISFFDGSVQSIKQNADIWEKSETCSIVFFERNKIKSIKLVNLFDVESNNDLLLMKP